MMQKHQENISQTCVSIFQKKYLAGFFAPKGRSYDLVTQPESRSTDPGVELAMIDIK